MRIARGISVTNTSKPISTAIVYDADAAAFFTAASITDTTQKSAVNTLVLSLKSANIWTKMKALYPVVGGVASAHAINLKQPGTYNLSFATGWTHSNTGMTSNGATYANTFLNSLTQIATTGHLSYYSRTQTISTTQTDIGNINNGAPAAGVFIASTATINVGYHGNSSFFTTQTISDKRGYIISSRLSSTSLKLYNNGSLINTQTSANSLSAPNLNLYIGARNNNNTADTYSTKECAFASIGDGLIDAEALSFYNAVQTMQTTLNRNV